MSAPNVDFWQERFETGTTPWDRGAASPQLTRWIESGELASCRILVPGCGSGHEVAALAGRGFRVTGLDYAPAAIARTRSQIGALPVDHGLNARIVHADALAWAPETPFDAIYEQTCLCAVYPDLWVGYAAQLHRWLRPGGRLFALFAQVPRSGASQGLVQGPPYHCDINGMRALLPADRWDWPKPPYPRVEHPAGLAELAVVLVRR
jgi:SAM-dependent methyltransferase